MKKILILTLALLALSCGEDVEPQDIQPNPTLLELVENAELRHFQFTRPNIDRIVTEERDSSRISIRQDRADLEYYWRGDWYEMYYFNLKFEGQEVVSIKDPNNTELIITSKSVDGNKVQIKMTAIDDTLDYIIRYTK